MKKLLALLLCLATPALADTPPARTINSETYDAAGNPITSTVEGPKRGLDFYNINPLSAPVPSVITDGTNAAAVKAATTPASVTDPALVVSISPNSPIEVTSVPPVNTHVTGTITDECPSGASCPAGSTVQVTTDGYTTVGYETHGTWSATMTTDISYDPACSATPNAVLWFNTASFDTDGNSSAYVTTWTEFLNNDPWVMNVAAAQCARLRAVAYTSGTVDITIDTGVNTAAIWAVAVGNARSGTTDAGNPVKIGGKYNSTPPTFTDGQRGDAQIDANGKLLASVIQNGNWSLRLQDGAGNNITSQVNGAQRALDVGVNVAGVQVDPRAIRALTSGTDTVNVNNVSGTVSLPTGAATALKQDTGNTSLNNIDASTDSIDTNIDVALSTRASAANQSTEITSLQLLDDVPAAMNGAFSKGSPAMGQLDDAVTIAATEDNVAPVRITAQRAAHTNLRNAAGTEVGTAANPVRTDPTGTTPQPATQSGTWSDRLQDGSGNNITSQANGAQRALDVGVNVSGVQVDPRAIRTLTSADVVTAAQGTAAAAANGWPVKPTDGTNSQSYTASSEAKVLVTPLTNSSIVKAQLQDNAGTAIVLGQTTMSASMPVAIASNQTNLPTNLTQISGASPSATNPIPVRQTDGTNFTGTYTNVTGADGTNSSPGQLPGTFALGVGWDGTTHREQAVDTSGNNSIVGNVAAAATDSGNPVKVGGKYESAQTSLTSGQRGDVHLSKFGDVTAADSTSFTNITTATTTTVKSGAGLLYAICFNLNVNNATVTIYDNTAGSGTKIGTVTTVLGGGADSPKGCSRYGGVNFSTGLTIVTSGATDLTILYK